MKNEYIYLDNNATTPCLSAVVDAMLPYMIDVFANTESVHSLGRQAEKHLNLARASIATFLGVKSYQVFFSSGATESNNFIFSSYSRSKCARRKVVVGAAEHKSVLKAAESLSELDFQVEIIPVDRNCVVNLEKARELIDESVGLVSVQLANNETGAIQPIEELVRMAHSAGAFFHCDAVQGLGKMDVDLVRLDVDSAVFSAHKIHGPKGIGVLYLKDGSRKFPYEPSLCGGEQEQGIRPGTVNLPGIIGMAEAFKYLPDSAGLMQMRRLRNLLEAELKSRVNCIIHSESVNRIPNTSNVAISGIPSDMLMANLSRLCISTGSACNSQEMAVSFVLTAMGLDEEEANSTVRMSISSLTTEEEIMEAVDEISQAVDRLKEML